MKTCLVLLICLVATFDFASANPEWSLYKQEHGKSYRNKVVESQRFSNFMATKGRIGFHNADASKPYKLGLNQFSDWSSEELKSLTGLKFNPNNMEQENSEEQQAQLEEILSKFNSNAVPDELDWRQVPNRVGAVKDQGHCGSCWAFATTGLLEGQQVTRNFTKELIPLSEQELVDCSHSDFGCGGGFINGALDDIKTLGGIESETAYPYKAQSDKCIFEEKKSIMSVKGSNWLNLDSEEELKKVVASYGPVAIGMYASKMFINYAGGIWEDSLCDGMVMPNHAVLLVGYGSDAKLGDYWIVKNSWGPKWGEQGFFKIRRGNNMCGVIDVPTIALF